jgi:hypothetical protein
MQYLRSMLARVRAWLRGEKQVSSITPMLVLALGPTIHRDVTPHGVRVYSVCGGCGARLECSATLCEGCARGPHTSAF